jgi:hypothetical protein
MTHHHFVLQPFSAGAPDFHFSLTGAISRRGDLLAITYTLTGPLRDLIIAPPAEEPARRWVLWETTCFECFLALEGDPGYWEGNLSPAGHWNFFRLTGYRQGIHEEPAIQVLPVAVSRQPGSLTLAADFDLAALIPPDTSFKVAISTVLQHQDGRLSFWALAHPGPEPDFHHPAGFIIKLSPNPAP